MLTLAKSVRRAVGLDSTFNLETSLATAGVPFSRLEDACKDCEAPCDLGEYPSLHIDTLWNMLGRVKPYARQAIISTGVKNWPKEVTNQSGSLAYYLRESQANHIPRNTPTGPDTDNIRSNLPGFRDTRSSTDLMILNGSFRTCSEDPDRHTVIVLPDFTFINDVEPSALGAEALSRTSLDPSVGRAWSGPSDPIATQKAWMLPYDCVIMLCSHKRRDNRCGVTAPILENALSSVLQDRGWEIHTEIDFDETDCEGPLSVPHGFSLGEKEEAFRTRMMESRQRSGAQGKRKRALILFVSHIGGHKLVGNMVIHWPSGTGVWYGRVAPNDVPAVVDTTIIKGEIIPELLRVAVNVQKREKACLHDCGTDTYTIIMSTKRSAPAESSTSDGQSFTKARASEKDGLVSSKRPSLPPDTNEAMGEFEDEWEDDLESDEDVVDRAAEELDGLDLEDDILPAVEEEDENPPEDDVFIPGTHTLGQDEVLEADQSVYEMLHHMNVTWPCLSFDVLRDALGNDRQRYPATSFVVTGTQADTAKNNEVLVMKMSQLHKTQKDDVDSDSDDEDGNDSVDEDAVLEYRSIPHLGGVNRIRAQQLPVSTSLPPINEPYNVATWSETGKVHIWDVRPLMESLDVPGYTIDRTRTNTPVFTVTAHKRAEGFALDWAPNIGSSSMDASSLRLLTGDIHSKIYLTSASSTGFATASQPFASHTSSVEDLQWSPSEQTVFASCSADKSIRVWDVRVKGRTSVVCVSDAHESDVNVISWNKSTSYLLASGGDEGGIKVWDLRNFQGSKTIPTPVALFSWHKAPITSIEWHPSEDSVFAASGADEQVTLWDLSVEHDDEEMGSTKEIRTAEGRKLQDVPPQLLFVHQGQKDVKEVHWHPQIPGAVLTTAADGFNIFKTISV